MILQALLVGALTILAAYAISQRLNAPAVSWMILIISVTGIVFVILPEWTTYLAELLGVGRGADLVLYVFIVVTLGAVFILHLRIRSSVQTTTALARSIALMSAQSPKRDSQEARD
jgi:small membrane protein